MEKRDISHRCAVWAEASVVDKARYEFDEVCILWRSLYSLSPFPHRRKSASLHFLQTEDILKTAEDIAGPYVWGRYDMVCLPPSFPFGGMENPCLTFITPTLIVSIHFGNEPLEKHV